MKTKDIVITETSFDHHYDLEGVFTVNEIISVSKNLREFQGRAHAEAIATIHYSIFNKVYGDMHDLLRDLFMIAAQNPLYGHLANELYLKILSLHPPKEPVL